MTGDARRRRATDLAETDEILAEFLRGANDPKDRALIIVLTKINANLTSTVQDLIKNTEVTGLIGEQVEKMAKEFNDHELEELKLFAQGQGMIKMLSISIGVVTFLLTTIGALGAYVANTQLQTLSSAVNANNMHDQRLGVLEERMLASGKRQNDIEDKIGALFNLLIQRPVMPETKRAR